MLNKIVVLMVVIVLIGQRLVFSASAMDSPEEKISSKQNSGSEQKLILPDDEL